MFTFEFFVKSHIFIINNKHMENLTVHQFYTELTIELDSLVKPSPFEIRKVGLYNFKLNLVSNTKTANGTIIYTYNNVI